MMRGALRNLLANAFEAMPAVDGRKLAIHVQYEHGSRYLSFQIKNAGEKLADERVSHLFDIGYSTKPGVGRGMGLAIVQHTMDKHGGRVEAKKIESGGLEITLSIPVAKKGLQNEETNSDHRR